ncbi:AAA domain-containing protein [Solibacillus sp. FSL H8-0523]|uniref:AAA domain-containing protein n=1 Tax=Solibacillus sp. FSL H8-0523 TaxID=2954511 RepID=UPI003100ADB5
MYRVKGNGDLQTVTLYAEVIASDLNIGERVTFEHRKDMFVAMQGLKAIGNVLNRQEINVVNHLLQLDVDYYAWVEDVNGQNIAVTIARPTQKIIDRASIAINLSKIDKPIQKEHYLQGDNPFADAGMYAYVAQHPKTQHFYLFSAKENGRANTLILNWEEDQLYALKEEKIAYKEAEKMGLLLQAKFFLTNVQFFDSTQAYQEANVTVEKPFPLYFESEKSYLNEWNAYMAFEQQKMNDIVASCQPLRYVSYKISYGKVIFELATGQALEQWQQHVGQVTVQTEVRNSPYRIGLLRLLNGRNAEIDFSFDDLYEEKPFDPSGVLKVSNQLEEVAQRRRKKALEKTLARTAVLPNLADYLSNPASVLNIESMKYSFPLHSVSTLVNGKMPDIPQENAIKAALNTNDLVLIQGPPGTGKTSVIQTIMKCLIELKQSEILITSYQHLAVDNAMQGLTEHGMLSHRYGGETYQQQLLATYQDITKKMATPILNVTSYEDQEQTYIEQLLLDLQQFESQPLHEQTVQQITQYVERLKADADIPTDVFLILLDLTMALPLTVNEPQASPYSAMYETLPKNGAVKTSADVEAWHAFYREAKVAFSEQMKMTMEPLLEQLKNVRRKMVLLKNNEALAEQLEQTITALCKLCTEQIQTTVLVTDDHIVQEALRRSIVELQALKQQSKQITLSEEQEILKQYAMEISANPLQLAEVIGRYAQVKGATCQQTVAKRHGMYDAIFDAVIVDEAARANPLDLLIPMTLGKKVILVGDHKQLPHILEPDFEQQLEMDAEQFDVIYSQSLFERLYKELPASKKVMLRKQFRMHPQIGRLVSRLFYPEGLQHGLPEDALANTSGVYDGYHLAWVNVPFEAGGESRRYVNEAEAKAVIKLVKQLVKDAKNIGNISIITFYAEQLNYLKKQLQNHGLEKQVAVGTVDAFQGKESDIVILSTVRSNDFKQESRALGFLRSPNRLNVAISRARSLLIVVGDVKTLRKSKMFNDVYEYIEECGYVDEHRRIELL